MFIRNKEDFKCENCGFFVAGDGYTNHCSQCLWSKHVDIDPGDRLAVCQGLMGPFQVEMENGETFISQKCIKCQHIRRNKVSKDDSYEVIISISSHNLKL
jgi:hypothetical protein